MVGTCLWVTHGSLAALVDELQLLGVPALSGPSAPVVSQRPVFNSQPFSRTAPVESPQLLARLICDCRFLEAIVARNLISTWCTWWRVCVATRVVDVACRWHCSSCLQLALLFHPLWVRSFPLWLIFSPAVGPLFYFTVSIMHRVVLDLDHASRRSAHQPLSSGFLSMDHLLFHLGHVF